MTDKARELLERIVTAWEDDRYELSDALYPLIEETRKLLALVKQEKQEVIRVTTEQRLSAYKELEKEIGDQANLRSFLEGICFAEKQLKNPQNTLNNKNSASTDALNEMQSHCRGDKIDCEPVKEVMHTFLGTNR